MPKITKLASKNTGTDIAAALRRAGFRATSQRPRRVEGFLLPVKGAEGANVFLDLDHSPFGDDLDPGEIGIATFDQDGFPQQLWGMAEDLPMVRRGYCLFVPPLEQIVREGGTLFHDGVRYYSPGLKNRNHSYVLTVNARDEYKARRQAARGWRVANILKRVGNTLTKNQTVQKIATSAIHEIASSADLAAALLWTVDSMGTTLNLVASVGVNRAGAQAVSSLIAHGGRSTAAEFVADSLKPLKVQSVTDNLLTSSVEGHFCYLKPKGACIWPLVIADKLVGVVELIGQEQDPFFDENDDLFETFAEHLALALHSAGLYEQAELSASHDALTGIPNHRTMQQFLHLRLQESERNKQQFAVVMIDVDHFRNFNEEEGHDAGDHVLRLVAQTLQGCVRPYDLAARYGGEEFTLLLPNTDAAGALSIAERARASVEQIVFVTAGGQDRPITISAGCSVFPQAASDGQGLLKAADEALYDAKRGGRNQVVLFSGHTETESREAIDVHAIGDRLREDERAQGELLLARATPALQVLSEQLKLSATQVLVLKGLMLVMPAYQAAWDRNDQGFLSAFEAAPEFRLLAPSLAAHNERYDGLGPRRLAGQRIPLLARALQALIAYAEDSGRSFKSDPDRFDPNITKLLIEFPHAA
jgi:diguanylate cyclase (GGDEF)-like protein